MWHFRDGHGTSGQLPPRYILTSNEHEGDEVLTVCHIHIGANGYGSFVDYYLNRSGIYDGMPRHCLIINGADAFKMERTNEGNTMGYKPKIIKGKAQNTGYQIDGHVLVFSQWDYDNHESWHLYGWDQSDDEAVMETMYRAEVDAGLQSYNTLAEFERAWNAGEWSSCVAFCLPLDQVEVLETMQEEEVAAPGAGIRLRELHDRGGIMCLPLDQNLNGDTQAKHPDWTPISCPRCNRKCWKPAGADRFQKTQSVRFMCTECAIKEGLLTPYKRSSNPHLTGNRAQRRRVNHEKNRVRCQKLCYRRRLQAEKARPKAEKAPSPA